jgi:hypothetical protein
MKKKDVFHSVLITLIAGGMAMEQAIKEAKEAAEVWESC